MGGPISQHSRFGFSFQYVETISLDRTQISSVGPTPAKQLNKGKANPPAALGISPLDFMSKSAQLNKTFCYLFTQKGCLFEMIIRTYLS